MSKLHTFDIYLHPDPSYTTFTPGNLLSILVFVFLLITILLGYWAAPYVREPIGLVLGVQHACMHSL